MMKCIECKFLTKDLQNHVDIASGMYDRDVLYTQIKYFCGHPTSFYYVYINHYGKVSTIPNCAREIPYDDMIDCSFCPLKTEDKTIDDITNQTLKLMNHD